MSGYEAPWDRRPFEIPAARGANPRWGMTKLDHALPAVLDLEGWHFRAWKPHWDTHELYYLYAPDETLAGRWEREPTISDLFDCWRQWGKQERRLQ